MCHLSIVVTARNDDHGVNLLVRMQTFVNALLAQCQRHQLPAELIIVEWNPPGDRPPLAEALRWPAQLDYCDVRIIQVPPELHRRYRHWQALPLYQMIAKNVGIRRARGAFILATNIDILFSDELIRFIAERRLERGKMYRIDRYDIMSDVPVDGSVEERLAYCRSHLIRVNAREGSFRIGWDGLRSLQAEESPRPLQPNDIATPDSGINLQSGWYEREEEAGKPFRWVNDNAEILIQARGEEAGLLVLDLEPGPGVKLSPFSLEIRDEAGERIARVRVKSRSIVRAPLALSKTLPVRLWLHVDGGGVRIASDLRTLNFRVFGCRLETGVNRLADSATVTAVGSWGAWGARRLRWMRERLLQILLPNHLRSEEPAAVEGPAAVHLHTNACGDFTLLAREHWFDLRGYPELDLFSMNIDSLFCWAAHHGGAREEILEAPMRIYHIDHGSGWTPEDKDKLYQRTTSKGVPWLNFGDCIAWARDMNRFNTPMIFNHDDWGIAAEELRESSPSNSATARV